MQDNTALQAAVATGASIVPVYIWDEGAMGDWAPGGASRWWLHHSLLSLDASLRAMGSRLIILSGRAGDCLRILCDEAGAGAVYWNRRYEPAGIACDTEVKADLLQRKIEGKSFNSALLFEPHTIKNKQGGPFQVFTPYWRHCLALKVEAPVKFTAHVLLAPVRWPKGIQISELGLLPKIPWDAGFGPVWQPGEAGAKSRLKFFIKEIAAHYADNRNQPAADGTSRLSPWLHFGEIGPRQIWAALEAESKASGVFPASNDGRVFLSEIGWREFAHHLLFHFPQTPARPLRPDFERFPWAKDAGNKKLRLWQRGLTGYPIVDAGMRQLWTTGWMHNRVRMIVASFLVKHLRLSWTHGAVWFWDTLVDADLANNTLGWQWSAGCGADSAPYFRIFAPVLQGEKFDAEGAYVRTWVPELKELSARWIHHPWDAPEEVLAAAGVELGRNYPQPMVDHAEAREEALAAFKSLKEPAS